MTGETCAEPGCPIVLPPYPDEKGAYWCAEHYDGDPQFRHISDKFAEYREQKVQEYDK